MMGRLIHSILCRGTAKAHVVHLGCDVKHYVKCDKCGYTHTFGSSVEHDFCIETIGSSCEKTVVKICRKCGKKDVIEKYHDHDYEYESRIRYVCGTSPTGDSLCDNLLEIRKCKKCGDIKKVDTRSNAERSPFGLY